MRLRSRGLGRKELVLDFREYEVVRAGDELVVVGTIRDPVNWDFTIRICEDDVPGMTWLVLRRAMVGLLLRAFFRRRKRHHWGDERDEHVAEGKRRRQLAGENADERARISLEPVATRRKAAALRRTAPKTSEPARLSPAKETSAADAG
ncbi:MAG: hypothetical protein JRH01_07985 [Deltaproteobacteria bacterium]|nr:hypothetical protein [Deltaproteobacteria bacterium]MBW2392676.1 hypothetical protein [Deltaproteobacteria bacterium]